MKKKNNLNLLISEVRTSRKLSFREFAKKIDVAPASVKYNEEREVTIYYLDSLFNVCSAEEKEIIFEEFVSYLKNKFKIQK